MCLAWRAGEGNTDHAEELEEVHVGMELVFDALQALRGEGADGVAHAVEPLRAREQEEALQQGLAAGDVLQTQVRHSVRKLGRREVERHEQVTF